MSNFVTAGISGWSVLLHPASKSKKKKYKRCFMFSSFLLRKQYSRGQKKRKPMSRTCVTFWENENRYFFCKAVY